MTRAGDSLPEPDSNWALFLDIDGTLIDIASTPTSVVVPPSLPDLLRSLGSMLDGAVAVVSGRSLADVDRLFAPLRVAGAGQHGAEIRLPDGTTRIFDAAARKLSELLPKVTSFAQVRPGILVENKGMTIAVHCRQVPQYQPELGQFLTDLAAQPGSGLETIRGHRVFEIKPRNLSKRTAVEHFMRAAPFAGRLPIFIGDDRTDEDGFAAVQALGGYAIHVGLAGPSIATWRIAGPVQTRAFLSHIVEILNADPR
ncbi:MAG: trehalose-phosphatase [Rhodospirillales bacterium]|nr:trehalose-phosphatase [Rhodospirillales bacterium]